MTFTEFCTANHMTVWRASQRPSAPDRWRIIVQWHDGSKHQLTLAVVSRTRPEAPAVLRALVNEARQFEANPSDNLKRWDVQRKLVRWLGPELYAVAMSCTD